MNLGNELSLKGKELFNPVRIALFGDAIGPDIPIILDILGKDEAIKRINKVLNQDG